MTTNTTTASQPNAAPSNNVLREALERIARWHGEFPETGKTWPDGTPTSYGGAFGSNGERDYMRQVAINALAAAPALPEPAAAKEPVAQPIAQIGVPEGFAKDMVYRRLRQIIDPVSFANSPQWHAADALYYLTGDESFADLADKLASPQPLAEVSAAQAVPEGCAMGSNGTTYHDVAEMYHQAECSEAFHMWLDDRGAPRNDDDERQFSLVGRIGRLPAITQAQAALQHALNICDSVPTRLHLSADEGEAQIGRLVNAQENGFHGYAVIRDALAAVSALAAAAPVAQPTDTTREA